MQSKLSEHVFEDSIEEKKIHRSKPKSRWKKKRGRRFIFIPLEASNETYDDVRTYIHVMWCMCEIESKELAHSLTQCINNKRFTNTMKRSEFVKPTTLENWIDRFITEKVKK